MQISEMKAGPELDALVAKHVMGLPENDKLCPYCRKWNITNSGWCCDCARFVSPYRAYSTSIEDAFEVVQEMVKDGFIFQMEIVLKCKVTFIPGFRITGSIGEIPLTICKAALRSMENV